MYPFIYRHASVGQPARTYLQQLCTDTRYNIEHLEDRDEWWERESQGNPYLLHMLMMMMISIDINYISK